MPDVESLLGRLAGHDVEFVLIGGVAALAHGASLFTEDTDICCRFSIENLTRLQEALEGLRPVHRMTPSRRPLVISPDTCSGLSHLYLDTDLGQLDCLSTVDGLGSFDDVLAESFQVDLEGCRIRILNLEALIRSKEAIGRPRDMKAVRQLREVLRRLAESRHSGREP